MFSKKLRRKRSFDYELKVTYGDHIEVIEDVNAFSSYLGELDLHLLRSGSHLHPYNIMGAHLVDHQGCPGVSFTVWAPNASMVSVVGEFNHWMVDAM